jgi:large subunit ribosomal protein L3
MTQVYNDDGVRVPVTVVEATPCTVLSLCTQEKHGYSAMQLGTGVRRVRNVSKAVRGHVAAAGLAEAPPAKIREIRLDQDSEISVGEKITVEQFAEGDFIDVTGQTKGAGFQGVVKRHGFAGGRASHGGGWVRRPGSIGMCINPGKVYKGRKMPGHMGSVRRTVQNLQIVSVRAEENLLLIKGAVPGSRGGYLILRSALKKQS